MVRQFLFLDDKGGEGVSRNPLFLADIICEQPLIDSIYMVDLFTLERTLYTLFTVDCRLPNVLHLPNRPVWLSFIVGAENGRKRGGHIVSALGRDEGYTVKYKPSPEGVPEGEARGNS